jgi:hypothetical protein
MKNYTLGGKNMKQHIKFDPFDQDALCALMDEHGDSETMKFGENENGEAIHVSIFFDHICVSTMQENGWVRVNTYWRDGTREETFDGKWK